MMGNFAHHTPIKPDAWWAKLPTLLAERTLQNRATPFRVHTPQPHIPMDRRMRPLHRSRNMSMLHRIAPAIRHMCPEIRFVPNGVLPKPTLPNASLPLSDLAPAAQPSLADGSTESRLDLAPSTGKISIPRRQCPNCVQMIWQNDNRVRLKRLLAMRGGISPAQVVDMRHQQVISTPRKIDSKEVGGTGNAQTTVSGHAPNIPIHG